MSQNVTEMTPFDWSEKSDTAAQLLALDELTDEQIAEQIKVTRRTLARWKKHPDFAARIAEHVAAFRAEIRQQGIAVMENRVREANARQVLMKRVIAERAADPDMQNVPGGKTGLIVRQVKGVGKGDDFQLIDLYAVDTGLLSEMRAHEMQVAKDLGQLAERSDNRDWDMSQFNDAELDRLLAGEAIERVGADARRRRAREAAQGREETI